MQTTFLRTLKGFSQCHSHPSGPIAAAAGDKAAAPATPVNAAAPRGAPLGLVVLGLPSEPMSLLWPARGVAMMLGSRLSAEDTEPCDTLRPM
jgi:hypothetical protein